MDWIMDAYMGLYGIVNIPNYQSIIPKLINQQG